MKKCTKVLLAVALCLCLVSSIFASLFQSSFNTVTVKDMNVVVAAGKSVNAQIYIPKNATPENKVPLIVVSHGSYNNLDHQDQNMIELSRRGFAVISLDEYNHGSSDMEVADASIFASQAMRQLIDYACASYTFIDTDKIGVAGHSMGGIISNATVAYYFAQEALGLGENKVSAVLDVGYDPQLEPYTVEGVEDPVDLTIDWGVICAKYDEWFFKGDTGNPADYLTSTNALTFVNQLDGVDVADKVENHKLYTGTIDGEEYIRVINQNNEIHPLNHFSTASCANEIDFFYAAFGVPSGYEKIDSADQIWQFKELFNLVGLIGIFLFLFPFASMLIHGTTFFGELAHAEPAAAPALNTGKRKAAYWITYAINLVVPALLVVPVMFKWVGKEISVPYTFNKWFGEPNTNELATWTLVVAVALLAVFLISWALTKDKTQKGIPECWGLKGGVRVIWKSFLLALATVTAAYVILFASDLIFNVDYRIWVIDMRVFNVQKVMYALAYFPAFAIFYLVNSMLVNGGNRVEGMPSWLVTLLSCVSNIAGIAALIIIQYATLISSGVFTFNSMRIVNLFPLIFLIPIGTIVTRRFYKETGSIYAGSFTIAMLYTMMTVANTMFLASVLG